MKPANFVKRALCLWLPQWSIQRICSVRSGPNRTPLVIYEEHRPGAFRVVDCCPLAQQHGVRPLMPLTEATALASPQLEKHEPQLDRATLEWLAEWCEQFSPAVALEPPDCLFMDVTGLVPIYGSEQALATQMRQAFHQRRLTGQIAVTDTYAAAWALAHCSGRSVVIVPPGKVVQAIAPLPIAGLNLPESMEFTFNELGIQTIGQLADLPRDSLAARFEPILLDRLDQVTGTRPEPLEFHHARPELSRSLEFENPIANRAILGSIAIELLTAVVPMLVAQQKGTTKFVVEFAGDDQPLVRMVVGLYQPTVNLKHLGELALLQLETLRFVGPISKVRLLVCTTARLQITQLGLFEDDSVECERQLALLVNRLSSRLGQASVLRATLVADAQAEFAYRFLPFTKRSKPKSVNRWGPLQRPIHLLPRMVPIQVLGVVEGPPNKFHWQGNFYDIRRAWGPERIQAGWWRGRYEKRDYYRVETTAGDRYWLFRRGDGSWFLHGIFD